ncbi:MAG: TRAP-type C4-dicarboxylate transport system, small permease component [Rhodobacteraceae bacterium HLUCCA12]|nr:MAG: TRAP-type C4-dicarboxylate transport system, small permease component [Rhodobacteraceae bacterium HLUCCA12]
MAALVGLIRAIEAGLRIAAALCLVGMFALVVAQVILRYTGGGVPVFNEEVARYAMIWMALLATAVAVREGSHIRIDLLPVMLYVLVRPLGRMLEFVLDTVALGVFLVLFWQGLDMVEFAAAQRSEGLRISLAWPYAAVPIAFALASLFALARLFLRDRLT